MKNWKQGQILFSWAPKSQVGDCSHEIKRPLPLGKKAMTNIDSVLKSRDKNQFAYKGLSYLMLASHKARSCKESITTERPNDNNVFFQQLCKDVKLGSYRRLSMEELMLLNCDAGEDSLMSLELQGDQTSQS